MTALIFLNVLILQHRQGRMVLVRSQSSNTRDMLTGLLNAQGFSKRLDKLITDLKEERQYAAMLYLQFNEMSQMREQYGEDGVDMGLVQVGAVISLMLNGQDVAARVRPNAFALCMRMPPSVDKANALAMQLLGRVMALAAHTAPMAHGAQIALVWLPHRKWEMDDIVRECQTSLGKHPQNKRIVWVGGRKAQREIDAIASTYSSIPKESTFMQESRDNFALEHSLPGIPDSGFSKAGRVV